jgi:hypothetical protein
MDGRACASGSGWLAAWMLGALLACGGDSTTDGGRDGDGVADGVDGADDASTGDQDDDDGDGDAADGTPDVPTDSADVPDGTPDVPGCVDDDGDGFGDGCAVGPDCLDAAPGCARDCADRNANGAPDCGEPPATLADYWDGRAEWKLVRKLTTGGTGWSYGFQAGTHIEVLDGAWYLFTRKVQWGDARCLGPRGMNDTLGTEVRRSTDHGATWSAPVDVVLPAAGTPWSCAATDGDVVYDAAADRWRFLMQCLDDTPDDGWNGCYLERAGRDPLGPFAPAAGDPVVVRGGDLWNRICDAAADDCSAIPGAPRRVFDEGTFDIVHHDGTFWWVGFHGYDGSWGGRGYRGLAKTSDFRSWIAGDRSQGVPADAIFDYRDTLGWRAAWGAAPIIGGGAARTIREAPYWYMLVEAADVNLGCTPGQNWHLGLLRSDDLTATSWEPFPAGNPVVYSSTVPEVESPPGSGSWVCRPCNVQYGGMFRDPGTGGYWLQYTRETEAPEHLGIHLYQLVPRANLLDNGDLWKCTAESWAVFDRLSHPTTNLVVYRHPNASTDGNCVLAANCGTNPGPCGAGQSVYQDVAVTLPAGTRLAFGGKFQAGERSAPGDLDVTLWELDATFGPLASHGLTVSATGSFTEARQEFALAAGTSVLRFQLYLRNPATTYYADELYVAPLAP